MSGKKSAPGRQRDGKKHPSPSSSNSKIMQLAKQVAPNSAALFAEAFDDDDDDEDDYEDDYEYDDGNASPLSLPSSMMSDDGGSNDTFHATYKSPTPSKTTASSSSGPSHHSTVAAMEEVHRLKQEKDRLAVELQRERQRYQSDMKNLRSQNRHHMATVRSKQAELEAELPVLRNRMEAEKDQFRDLKISDALYQEIKEVPENRQSLREFVLCRVHGMLQEVRGAEERARQEVESLRSVVARSKEDSDRRSRDAEHRANVAEERCAQLEHAVASGGTRYAAVAAKLNEAVKEAEVNRSKALAYDDVHREGQKASNERDSLRERNERLEKRVNVLDRSREASDKERTDAKQQVSILTIDKSYLERETTSQRSQIEILTKDVETLRMKNRALSRSKDEFYEQLLVAKDAARTGYEERLANDIEKLHLANDRELSEVRSATQKVYERENQTLREAKHDAEERLKQASLKLNALERAYDDTRLALARAQSDREAENGELRARTKVKEYELERAMLSIEDKTKEIKSLELSLEQTKSRFNVLREEFARLDALSRASPGSIMNGGLLENSGKENRLSPHMEQENRRLKHRIDVLEREKNVLEQKVKRLTDDYEDLRKSTSQPQDYFMSMVDKAKLENETARSTIEDLRGEIESLSQSKEDAEVQLRKLLSNREQIKDLKKALLNAGVVARRTAYGEGMGGTMSQSPRNSRERGSPRWYKRLVKP